MPGAEFIPEGEQGSMSNAEQMQNLLQEAPSVGANADAQRRAVMDQAMSLPEGSEERDVAVREAIGKLAELDDAELKGQEAGAEDNRRSGTERAS